MREVKIVSNVVLGTGSAVKVVLAQDNVSYLGLYAKVGSCIVSFGESTHADVALTIAQGNWVEPEAVSGGNVYYSGAATELVVLSGRGSAAVMTYDKVVLTYDGVSLFYRGAAAVRTLDPPVFG